MSSFDLDPVESATLQENALRDSILPTDIPAGFFQGAGTGLWNGLKSGDYRVKAEQAFRDTPEELAKRYEVIKSLKPDPKTIGFLGQNGFNLGEFTAVAGENLLSGDVVPTLLSKGVAGTYEKTGTELNVLEGMDRATAANVAKTEAIFQGLGVVAPAAVPGKLAMRAGSGAAIQVGMGAAERASMAYQLNQAGYPEMAAQYKVFDTAALLTDAILGGGVAAIGGNHAERPGSFRENTNPNQVDALLTMNQAAHIETGTAPGLPITPESRQAHVDAHAKAMEDLINGNPVDVGTRVTEAEFLPHPDMDAARLEIGQALAEHIRSIPGADQAFIDLENLKAMARDRGLEVEDNLFGKDAGIMPADVEVKLKEQLGGDASKLVEAGKIKIVGSVEELNRATGGAHPVDVQAMHDPKSGISYLVANNIEPEKLKGIVLHEVGVHAGMEEMLGADLYKKLLDDVNNNSEAPFVEARAIAEQNAAQPEHIPEETLAYLVENHKDLPLVKQIIANARQWLYRVTGGKLINLTDADIASMALSSLRRQARKTAIETGDGAPWYSRDNTNDYLYHGSPESNVKINSDGLFGGIFASSDIDSASSHGNGFIHRIKKSDLNIMKQSDLETVSDNEILQAAHWADPEQVDRLRDLIIYGEQPTAADIDLMASTDTAEASWMAQKLRGEIARDKGFNSVEMPDEHGMSYLVLPSVNVEAFDHSNADARYSRRDQTDKKQRSGEQFTAKGIIADKPDMTIASVDGTPVPAAQAIQQADANIATAKTESKAFSVAVTCGLRG